MTDKNKHRYVATERYSITWIVACCSYFWHCGK